MPAARIPLASRDDLLAQVDALQDAGGHILPVSWQGEPAWLKLSVPRPPAWRYQLQAALAQALQLSALQPVRPQGGAAGIANEAARLTALAAAGVHVPRLIARADHWLLMSDLGTTTLESLIRNAPEDARLTHWQRGADYIAHVHRAGQYLSQPFARNLVWSETHGVGAIDFEDDPAGVMSLAQAQARDWLPYFFSTAIYFPGHLPRLARTIAAVLGEEPPAVRDVVHTLLRRTAWVRVLRGLPQRMHHRDVRKTVAYGQLAHACTRATAE
jgi:hypothetical protein